MKHNSKSNFKFLIIMTVGFFFVLLELGIQTDIGIYPDYAQDFSIGTQFQYYTVNTFFGAKLVHPDNVVFSGLRIPLFSDVIGYILIITGAAGLKNRSGVFNICSAMAFLSGAMYVVIKILPFMLNGSKLCYIAMCLGIAQLGLEISVGYFFICALCDILSGVSFRTDRVTMGVTWFAAAVCRIIVFVTAWVHLPNLTMVYNMILFWLTVFLFYCIFKLRDFVTGNIVFDCQNRGRRR